MMNSVSDGLELAGVRQAWMIQSTWDPKTDSFKVESVNHRLELKEMSAPEEQEQVVTFIVWNTSGTVGEGS